MQKLFCLGSKKQQNRIRDSKIEPRPADKAEGFDAR
jgi:hypothetical protein